MYEKNRDLDNEHRPELERCDSIGNDWENIEINEILNLEIEK